MAVRETPFSRLLQLCEALRGTTKRKEKTRLITDFLRELKPEELAPTVLLTIGSIFPEYDERTLDVGFEIVKRALKGRGQRTLVEEPLTILGVYRRLTEIAEAKGPGSRLRKERLLEALFSRATKGEVELLIHIIFGEMRIGVNEGVMLEALSEASGLDLELLRRALMLTGDLGEVARVALLEGETGVKGISPRIFHPLKPMLASLAEDVQEALEEHGGLTAFEYKLDGARIQIHRRGGEIRVFSRRLSDVTESLPDVVALLEGSISSDDVILEGEVVAVGRNGRPLPFQDLMRRFRRVHDVEEMVRRIPLRLHLFDILYLDGRLLIDDPYEKRWRLLESICPDELLARRIITGDTLKAEAFLREAMERGHEGLMAKRLDSPYTPGRRGKLWLKIKPAETLDAVIIAAEWGHGRRRGWLSNYHLAVRDDGGFSMVGKTFKGLTDEEFRWMTRRLQELKVGETPTTVYVKPEIVVEVAFNEIQRSPHYPSGFALRFARIKRIREDKSPEEADTLERLRELYERQFRYKARL
jgi:DNA ligase-1